MRLREIVIRIRNAAARRIAVHQSLPHEPPINLSKKEASRARFCFLGEFGYEMISWVPYIIFLKERLGIRVRTIGRLGSSIFYYFSDEHTEVDASYIGGVWGDPASYARVAQRFAYDILVFPGKDLVNRRHITIEGYEWTNKNIHARINERNYIKPDYSFISPFSPVPRRQIVIINNKYIREWPGNPVNFFDRPSLVFLRDLLVGKGYGVVYNHFVELTAVDQYSKLDDEGVFGKDDYTYDMQEFYASCTNVGERNRTQLALYNASKLVIGPQGGNLYLPAICRRPLYVLMREGDYIDHLELKRLYDIPVEVFYEPRHMMCWIARKLPDAG